MAKKKKDKKDRKGKKDKKKKKKSQKSKSKKRLKKSKGEKKRGKKKSDKKSKKKSKKKKSSAETVDAIQQSEILKVGKRDSATTAINQTQPTPATQSVGDCNYGTNCAIFEWDGSNWKLVEDYCDYGCVPRLPEEPGTYVNERIATACKSPVEGMPCPPSEQAE